MISRDSKSYPYLAIAQHYNVPYAEVLWYSDALRLCYLVTGKLIPPDNEWWYQVYELEMEKLHEITH